MKTPIGLTYLRHLICTLGVIVFISTEPRADTIKIERIGAPLSHAWGMSFLTENKLVVSERRGRLVVISLDTGSHQNIADIPEVFHKRQGGLLDVLVQDDDVYLCFSKPHPDGATTAVIRGTIENQRLVRHTPIFESHYASRSGVHFGCRLLIHDNALYISLGDRGERETAQNPNIQTGAVVRLRPDGDVIDGNSGQASWDEAVFTIGHRNPQGMAVNPYTNQIWVHEHGPKGGDEINILSAGKNYGWPVVSHGREYYGARIGKGLTSAPGFADPVWIWIPSIAPSGMAFYTGSMFPEMTGDVLVGSLKFRSLYHVKLLDNQPISETALITRKIGRIRDVEIAPDGSILVLTDEQNGGLYRIFK